MTKSRIEPYGLWKMGFELSCPAPIEQKGAKHSASQKLKFNVLCRRLGVPTDLPEHVRWISIGRLLAAKEPEFLPKPQPQKRKRGRGRTTGARLDREVVRRVSKRAAEQPDLHPSKAFLGEEIRASMGEGNLPQADVETHRRRIKRLMENDQQRRFEPLARILAELDGNWRPSDTKS
jgi:hypothetical protein